ncbi:sugar transferase [Candidatus Berkelbacteria bacterium]|nr:sugar transferase [Candidatus Berkelbacteria bacterium]
MKRSELFFSFLLVPVDAIAVLGAFSIAYWLRAHQEVVYIWQFSDYFRFIFSIVPFWILIFALEGLYAIKNTRRGFDEAAGILLGVSSGIMLFLAYIFLSRTEFFSRLIVIYAWVLSFLLVGLGRLLIRTVQKRLLHYGIGLHRVLVIGKEDSAKHIIQAIGAGMEPGFEVVKIVSSIKQLNLDRLMRETPFDEIIVATSRLAERTVVAIVEFCHQHDLVFRLVPSAFRVQTSHVDVAMLGQTPMLEFRRTPLEGWGKIIKRIIDIIGGFIALIIFAPLMLIVAIIIKIVSPGGPILFHQRRVGVGKLFTFYKFRTMMPGAELEHDKLIQKHGNMFKLKEDPRVFPFGSFLRKTSIDELPQLFNVLKGEMSLVGPRPPMQEEVRFYNSWHRQRLGIKPGITGLWQVSGRSEINFDEWVRLDLYYIEHWSLWLDLQILLKTVWVVIAGKGAY